MFVTAHGVPCVTLHGLWNISIRKMVDIDPSAYLLKKCGIAD